MSTNATEYKNNKIYSNLSKVPSDVEGKDSDSDDISENYPGKIDLSSKQEFHIIESIEDLRHIRADLFQIMVERGEEGHVECSNIIEKAILARVKIISKLDIAERSINELDNSLVNQINSDLTTVLRTYDDIQATVVLLKVDMLQILNINVDFADADGD